MTFDDAKELTCLFTGERLPSTAVVAGIVMLAPLFCRSWDVDDIVKATGFKRNQVERCVANFILSKVWQKDAKTGEDVWSSEWCEIFVAGAWEKASDEHAQRLCMSFVLDAMVGSGEIVRTERDGEFFYCVKDRV